MPQIPRNYAEFRIAEFVEFRGISRNSVTFGVTKFRIILILQRGLLDRSTARYIYKRSKTTLHKHTGNLVENLCSKKCACKKYLQLLALKFLSQTSTTL